MIDDTMPEAKAPTHRCPVWVGYLLASPLRRLFNSPDQILSPYVHPGMTVVDLGCAMGFFSIPLARMVGPQGRVVCVDVEQRMLASLRKRAVKAGVAARIEPRCCDEHSLGLDGLTGVDFALAFAMVHEVPDARRLFTEVHALLAPGAGLLVAEPRGHVEPRAFEATLAAARAAGFEERDRPRIRSNHAAYLVRPA